MGFLARFASHRGLARLLLATGFLCGADRLAQGADESAPAADAAVASQVLIFKDGDRLSGRLLRQEGDILVFESRHAGELRVPVDAARVETLTPNQATAPAGVAAPAAIVAAGGSAAAQAAAAAGAPPGTTTPWWKSPGAFSENVVNFLGAWKGHFGVGLSLVDDQGHGENLGADLSFSRKWTNDEAKFETHYYYAETDDVVKTDLFKGSGIIRHDFKGPVFVSYRPTVEWNRNHFVDNQPADYVLGQHSIGVGLNLIDTPGRKAGIGVAENIFDLWTLDTDEHSTRDTQSLFAEIDWELPWRISINGRATWYYSLATNDRGREDQFDVTKKFSDTLSLGLRWESRQNNPDERIADYSLLRFQLGVDF